MGEFDALVAALHAVLKPLGFAARNDGQNLTRVVDIDTTLKAALARLSPLADGTTFAAPLARARAHYLSDAPLAARVQALWRALAPLADETPRPQRAPEAPRPPAAPVQRPAAAARAPASRGAAAQPPALGAHTPLAELRGVGKRTAEQLATRDLHTVIDLLRFLPRRYQGRQSEQEIGALVADQVVSVEGVIQTVSDRFVRGRHTMEVTLADVTGSIALVWFRVPHRAFVQSFRRGARLRAAGQLKRFRNRLQISHPEISWVTDSGVEVGAQAQDGEDGDEIVPLYLDIEGVYAQQLRRLMRQALELCATLPDPLPHQLRVKRRLLPLGEALRLVHRPPGDTPLEALQSMRTPAQQRLIYDELLALQLEVVRRRSELVGQAQAPPIAAARDLAALGARVLPFAPTGAQRRVLGEMGQDLQQARPMQRLLQGDVGSGKTAVALVGAIAVARAGGQTALMVPTELLAEQHARTAAKILAPLGLNVALLTGALGQKARRELQADIDANRVALVVGTHALIQQNVRLTHLALAIVDEQHRFGVAQRARLSAMRGGEDALVPHVLVMTATPIPRTLALTAYGDLDVSLIDELPPGRTPVVTKLFRDGERALVYKQVRARVEAGEQAYVVFPLVEDSDKEGVAELRAATSSVEELAQGPLAGLRLGLLHGRLQASEKAAVMQAFLRRDMDVLVATTVIEVGIDVPNASVMVIEHAERFGLSQLHQLRGRVGRGQAKSHCLLIARARPQSEAWRRLEVMVASSDGFYVAEQDLEIRGPGDFLGTRQSGLPLLTVANLARDGALLVAAREDAQALARDPTQQNSLRNLQAALGAPRGEHPYLHTA